MEKKIEEPSARADHQTDQISNGELRFAEEVEKLSGSVAWLVRNNRSSQQLGVENVWCLVPHYCAIYQYKNRVLWSNDAVVEASIHIDNMFAIVLGSIFRASLLSGQTGTDDISEYISRRVKMRNTGDVFRRNESLGNANHAVQEYALDSKEIQTLNHVHAIYRLGKVTFAGCVMERVRIRLNELALNGRGAAVTIRASGNTVFQVSQLLQDTCRIMAFKSGRDSPSTEHGGVAEGYAFEALVIWECQQFVTQDWTKLV